MSIRRPVPGAARPGSRPLGLPLEPQVLLPGPGSAHSPWGAAASDCLLQRQRPPRKGARAAPETPSARRPALHPSRGHSQGPLRGRGDGRCPVGLGVRADTLRSRLGVRSGQDAHVPRPPLPPRAEGTGHPHPAPPSQAAQHRASAAGAPQTELASTSHRAGQACKTCLRKGTRRVLLHPETSPWF